VKDSQKQIIKFILIGISAVTVDFVVYYLLSFVIFNPVAKAIGFITGSVYTFYMNKHWTWKNKEKATRKMWISFILLYGVSMLLNVGINELVYYIVPDYVLHMEWATPADKILADYGVKADKLLAFIAATMASAVFNFTGQKRVVFKQPVIEI
jgi:putative flippase GtrA